MGLFFPQYAGANSIKKSIEHLISLTLWLASDLIMTKSISQWKISLFYKKKYFGLKCTQIASMAGNDLTKKGKKKYTSI